MLITFLVINMSYLSTFSQKTNSSPINAEQTYVYEDDNVKIKFLTNKVEFSLVDTLVMKADIKNVSSTCIYFFNNHSIEFLGDESNKDRIIIDFGSRIGSGITYLLYMVSIKPHETYHIQ